MDKNDREVLSEKCREYALEEFNLETTIDSWHNTLLDLVENWKVGNRTTTRFEMIEMGAID
jgi:hypothetical protein